MSILRVSCVFLCLTWLVASSNDCSMYRKGDLKKVTNRNLEGGFSSKNTKNDWF